MVSEMMKYTFSSTRMYRTSIVYVIRCTHGAEVLIDEGKESKLISEKKNGICRIDKKARFGKRIQGGMFPFGK